MIRSVLESISTIESDIKYFRQKLKMYSDPTCTAAITAKKQLELLEDAVIIYRLRGASSKVVYVKR